MKALVKVKGTNLLRIFKQFTSFSSMTSSSTECLYLNKSFESSTISEHDYHLRKLKLFIPKLTNDLYKGQCGRIGVIGGSFEYTGAPYFAAISSLKLGADLVHVFCCQQAGPVIKSYSPELIVHPVLDSQDVIKQIEPWLQKMHVLVIGPGLGRKKEIQKNVSDIIILCKKKLKPPIPLVIDADGLFLITQDLSLIKDYKGPLILTPNSVEYTRLSIKMSEEDPLRIAGSLNAVLLQKGNTDIITNGINYQVFHLEPHEVSFKCDVPGSNRRCGGQGDVLSGCVATFIAWLQIYLKHHLNFDFSCTENKDKEWFRETYAGYSLAVYGACVITRTCNRLAFESIGRGMTASDMISFIHKAFTLHFGQ